MKKNVAWTGMLTAMAILVSYIEFLIPIPFPIVGMKLGLANVVVVVALYRVGEREAIGISMMRVVLVALLFGNLFSGMYAFAGAMSSVIAMIICKRLVEISILTNSIIGAMFHSVGQIIVARVILQNKVVYTYLPMLLLIGICTGGLVGVVAWEVLKRMSRKI
ncbi:MAG: Gx transporter family protein [Eubacteriales bacterium]